MGLITFPLLIRNNYSLRLLPFQEEDVVGFFSGLTLGPSAVQATRAGILLGTRLSSLAVILT